MIRASSFLLVLLLTTGAAGAERSALRGPIEGPVEADLISVVDGDTLLVEARPWPQQTVTVLVRIRGIDAPELKAKCEADRQAALRARQQIGKLAGRRIRLTNVGGDKYFGRVVADVSVDGGSDLGSALIARGLVKSYDGGRRKARSC